MKNKQILAVTFLDGRVWFVELNNSGLYRPPFVDDTQVLNAFGRLIQQEEGQSWHCFPLCNVRHYNRKDVQENSIDPQTC